VTDGRVGGPGSSADATLPAPPLPGAVVVHGPAVARTVRGAGRLCIAAAVLVVAAVAVGLVGGGPARTVAAVLAVLGLGVAVAAGLAVAFVLTGRGPRLVLDADGFDNRTQPHLPGRSVVRAAPWSQVRKVQAVREGGRRLLVITLSDSRRSVVLLRRLAEPPPVIEESIRDHLDAAGGYRPFGVIGAPPGASRPGRPA